MLGLPHLQVKTIAEYEHEGVFNDELLIVSLVWTSLNAPTLLSLNQRFSQNMISWL